jgi:type IV pilus assembly protein PilE
MQHATQPRSEPAPLRPRRNTGPGWSLIELLIVLALMGLLTALALPNYREHLQRSHRAHARAALLQAAQWMERAATVQGSYPRSPAQIPASVLQVEGGRYTLSVDSPNGDSFTLRAQAQGPQASDPCATFELTHTGQRAQVATPNVPTPLTALECWNR